MSLEQGKETKTSQITMLPEFQPEEKDPRDEILEPIIFTQKDIEAMRDMPPREIFKDPRFLRLLGEKYIGQIEFFDRVLDLDQSLSKEEIQDVGLAFRIALIRWGKTVARLEKVEEYDENSSFNKPFDIDEVAKIFTDAASEFFTCLEQLDYVCDHQDPMLDGVVRAEIWRDIKNNIRQRIASVVLYENALVASSEKQINRDLAGLSSLRTVGEMQSIPLESDLHFKGSKRSDIAATTNGGQLLKNLRSTELDPKRYEVFTLKLSGNPVIMVLPRAAQGQIGLHDLFKEVGVFYDKQEEVYRLLNEHEVEETPDIFFLGVPDEMFDGVEGIVQEKDGGIQEVDGGYKRFHYTRENGATVYVVGKGEDSFGKQIDYFGPFKKAPYQLLATRQVQDSTELLTKTGKTPTQPDPRSNSAFRYPDVSAELRDQDVLEKIVMPYHGTFLVWGNKDPLKQVERQIRKNRTINHTLFEGQSGMGKSEMELFIRVILDRLRYLHDLMQDSSNETIQGLARGLASLNDIQLYSAGDDMGQLEFKKDHNGNMALFSRTHERRRFTRTDNVPAQEFIARNTYPLDEKGNPAQTTNTRVLQVDEELEKLHEVPINVRIFALASNLTMPVDRIDPEAIVQEVDALTYLRCYEEYVNTPNGTKDTDDPVKSTAAMHEFIGQFTTAGGNACENIVELRKFMVEQEMKRRIANNAAGQMKFYIINTGIKPEWISQEEYDSLSGSDRQKLHFAYAASQWSNVEGLVPPKVQAGFEHAEKNLGIDLAQLAFYSENWSVANLKAYLSKKVRSRVTV